MKKTNGQKIIHITDKRNFFLFLTKYNQAIYPEVLYEERQLEIILRMKREIYSYTTECEHNIQYNINTIDIGRWYECQIVYMSKVAMQLIDIMNMK